jgi:hypothetical protein
MGSYPSSVATNEDIERLLSSFIETVTVEDVSNAADARMRVA